MLKNRIEKTDLSDYLIVNKIIIPESLKDKVVYKTNVNDIAIEYSIDVFTKEDKDSMNKLKEELEVYKTKVDIDNKLECTRIKVAIHSFIKQYLTDSYGKNSKYFVNIHGSINNMRARVKFDLPEISREELMKYFRELEKDKVISITPCRHTKGNDYSFTIDYIGD